MPRFMLLWLALMLIVPGLLSTTQARQAQDEKVFQQIFGKTQERFGQAKSVQADILAPEAFGRALKKYNEAREDFRRGRALADINRKLGEISVDLDAAVKTANLGKVALEKVLRARDDALKAAAEQNAAEKFTLADKVFGEATRRLEGGDVNAAQKKGEEAEQLFREAELHAIKNSVIGSVRSQLVQARTARMDRLAPETYRKAEALLAEAEKILNTNRYAAGSAREKAEAAEYEVRHARHLAEQIQRVKVDETQWEKFLLSLEQKIASIAAALDFEPQFEQGLDKPVNDIREAVKSLRDDRRSLSEEVGKLESRLAELSKELNTIREAQAGLESQLEKEKRRQQELQRREERIKAVETMFTPEEAVVTRENDRLRIRLIGLVFPSGKAIIMPEYFPLLTKLQRAIRELPDCFISVEGHTDSRGDDANNQRISTERALSVQQYLVANMNLPANRIQAVGFGENFPIASNDSEEGRARNRRIEVVLTLPQ
ncbi:MAG: OmpA family protein [candidate division KSB1 bacterium]|nr:OmpA family protein [candidate division KSB1 bacterium]MDZ7275141.1 OmpA family protein [candidate division KSB1 bacterium]MDZ7287311.1 OmpA family protein [candidate division KSB1 bacterium]MDZ7299425.1 OmpA family protein [candidate division KSB1 bacterium]MDZ7308064.1 OmpA family protein [candidate division KSB1 bacterium]